MVATASTASIYTAGTHSKAGTCSIPDTFNYIHCKGSYLQGFKFSLLDNKIIFCWLIFSWHNLITLKNVYKINFSNLSR